MRDEQQIRTLGARETIAKVFPTLCQNNLQWESETFRQLGSMYEAKFGLPEKTLNLNVSKTNQNSSVILCRN